MEKLKETLDDLSLTNEEIRKLTEAFKKEEFKKLFREYAEELQDPENKKKYEEELTAMENERGMDIEFINPLPGHVLKTIQNSEKKVFINICQSEKIEKPSVNKTKKGNVKGATWSIPHSFSSPREDIDKKRESCLVYDVVFNINAYQMSTKNLRFRTMLHDTALEGIEKMFKVNLDKTNFKVLKLKMKGVPVSTVIRKKRKDFEEKQATLDEQKNDPLKFPYPDVEESVTKEYNVNSKLSETSEFVKPSYKIIYSDDFEITNYVGEEVKLSSRPKKMIIEIKLPLISSANCVDLDIDKSHLKLITEKPVKYLLELKLTYPVLSDLGSAKFERATKTLRLELPIEQIQEKVQSIKPDDDNHLIEEAPMNISENDPIDSKDSDIESDEPFVLIENNIEASKSVNLIEIERIIPKTAMKFRKNNTNAFLLCEIRNIEKSNWNVEYSMLTCFKMSAIINFSTCGQGGWQNFYKIPIVIEWEENADIPDNYIQCLISDENMVIQLPLNIDSGTVVSISVLDHSYPCRDEPLVCNWKSTGTDDGCENIEETETSFNVIYGMVNKETLKIICTPIDCILDVQQEFPLITNEHIEITNDASMEITNDASMEITNDVPMEIDNKDVTDVHVEDMKPVIETFAVKEDINNKESLHETVETKSSIIPSEYFEHRTSCAVELSSNLLFDLE